MREYQPIWIRIKTKNKCTLEVARFRVDRVKKAVLKEKDMDISFKNANLADPLRLIIEVKEIEDKPGFCKLTFLLKQRFGIQDKVITV